MSQQHIDLWRQAADAFDQRYNAIGDDQWQQATPCTEWQVRQLVDHAVGVQQSLGGNTVGADIEEGPTGRPPATPSTPRWRPRALSTARPSTRRSARCPRR